MKRYNKIIMICMPILFIAVLIYCVTQNRSFVFPTENREATTLKDIDSFSMIDHFLVDQFPHRELIIEKSNEIIDQAESSTLQALNFKVQDLKERYLLLKEKFYLNNANEKAAQPTKQMMYLLNVLSKGKQNVYLINAGGKAKYPEIYLENGLTNTYGAMEKAFMKEVPKNIHVVNNDWDAAHTLKYFYHTDHHLNLQGTIETYKRYVKTAGLPDYSDIFPRKSYPNVKFFGSDAKAVSKYDIADEGFDCLDFDKIPFHYEGNGKPYKYHNLTDEEIVKRNKARDNYYAVCFGLDFGKLVIKNPNDKTGKNLLIIGDSYSNSLNHMLAYNYNTVVDIDTRYYASVFKEKADLQKLIQEYNIDDILVYTGITNSDLINMKM